MCTCCAGKRIVTEVLSGKADREAFSAASSREAFDESLHVVWETAGRMACAHWRHTRRACSTSAGLCKAWATA